MMTAAPGLYVNPGEPRQPLAIAAWGGPLVGITALRIAPRP